MWLRPNRLGTVGSVADPYLPNPLGEEHPTTMCSLDRLIAAILLGVLTYDANLLVIEPDNQKKREEAGGQAETQVGI